MPSPRIIDYAPLGDTIPGHPVAGGFPDGENPCREDGSQRAGPWFTDLINRAVYSVRFLTEDELRAEGWFFRDMSSHVALRQLQTESETIRSHPMLWSLVVPVLLVVAGIVLR